MTDGASAYTHIHPASEKDRETVHDILRIIRDSGKQDSGAVVLNKIKEISSPVSCVTLPFDKKSILAEWVVTPGADSSAIIIYLHGRRFQYDEPAGVYAALISQATRLTVLKVNYRLAPEFPYPAALADVLAAYEAVLALGVPPNRVFLVGHSAGATLCLSALLSLAGSGRPFPAATLAISPIIDFTFTADSLVRNQGKDAASLDELRQARQAYLGGIRPDQAPQSPLFGDLKGLPPVLLVSGGSELLLDDSIHFAAKAAKAGVDIALDIFEEMPHGFAVMRLSASDQVLSRVSAYIASRLRQCRSGKVGPLTLERVGWAGYVITTEYGTKILVDPYLSGNEGFHQGIPESFITPKDLFGVDVIAVTHAGFDHRGQSLEIFEGGSAIMVSGPALYEDALKKGAPAARLAPVVSGVELHFRDITIKALPARHESSMKIDGATRSDQPLSFLLTTSDGVRIFCGGDTSISEDMKTWRELYQPDIAVLGIGGMWLGPLDVTELPPADAALAAKWLGVRTVIPMHYAPGDPAPAQLKANLLDSGNSIEVVTLKFGETWTLRSNPSTM
jgi:acetyl esterase/lipase/L-ascorbate metabolism protein UlaG (beta-lactamase superfamily)